MIEKNITHEIKLDRSIITLLWAFVIGLILNTIPSGTLLPKAYAELSSNPEITIILREGASSNVDLDD
jgi:hypothetical protein